MGRYCAGFEDAIGSAMPAPTAARPAIYGLSSVIFAERYEAPAGPRTSIHYALSITDSISNRAIKFYQDKTIPEIASPLSRSFWESAISAAIVEESIKHAVVAFSTFHEQFLTGVVVAGPPLRYYILAVRHLRDGIPTVARVLCLMIFFAIEWRRNKLLHRSHMSAMQLFRTARQMMLRIEADGSEFYNSLKLAMRRVERQIIMTSFLYDYLSDRKQVCGELDPQLTYDQLWGEEPFVMRSLTFKDKFRDFRDAWISLFSVAKSYANAHTPDHGYYLRQIYEWRDIFQEWLLTAALDEEEQARVPSLEVSWRHYILTFSKDRDDPVIETWWDQHEKLLSEIVHFVIVDPHFEKGAKFGLEYCLLWQLYDVGRRCRTPKIRKSILEAVGSVHFQEGLLTSNLIYEVVSKIQNIEQAGLDNVQSAHEIPVQARIQNLMLDFTSEISKMRYQVGGKWNVVNLDMHWRNGLPIMRRK